MFVELMPLLGERTVMITVARLNQNSIRVNVIPSRRKEDENAALATPLSFSGTPEELDRELGSSLASYVEDNLRLQTALAEAKTEMEGAACVAPAAPETKHALEYRSEKGATPFNILQHVDKVRKVGRNYVTRCPSCAEAGHDRGGDNLAILIRDTRFYKCWAGCTKEMIRAALGHPIRRWQTA